MTVVAAATDICGVTAGTCGNAVLACALQNFVIYSVNSNNTGAAAAVKGDSSTFIFDDFPFGLCNQRTGHVLSQIYAKTRQTVGIGAGEVGVGNNSSQRDCVFFGNVVS